MIRLAESYYLNQDVVGLARDMLGKVLVTHIGGIVAAGLIAETEAYAGINDRASHAFGERRTNRNEVMYHRGGKSYVYLCYGIHHLFNIVTHDEGIPHAILIRSIIPIEGIEVQLRRRSQTIWKPSVTQGPGKVSQAMGITVKENGVSLLGNRIWVEDRGVDIPKEIVNISPRIGIDYAGEDASLPYRFYITYEGLKNHHLIF